MLDFEHVRREPNRDRHRPRSANTCRASLVTRRERPGRATCGACTIESSVTLSSLWALGQPGGHIVPLCVPVNSKAGMRGCGAHTRVI